MITKVLFPLLCFLTAVFHGVAFADDPTATLSVNVVPATSGSGPCDIAAAAGTPCLFAHSYTRVLNSSYAGPLVRMIRTSDMSWHDVGSSGGALDQAALNQACPAGACLFSGAYDQMGDSVLDIMNDDQNPAHVTGSWHCNFGDIWIVTLPHGTTMPIPRCGKFHAGTRRGLSNNDSMPTGTAPMGLYMVVDGNLGRAATVCCYDYGNMEAVVGNHGQGTMFSIMAHQNGLKIDHENGVWAGATGLTPISVGFAKIDGSGVVLKQGNALSPGGGLITLTMVTPPYGFTMAMEGGLSLGEPGDQSEWNTDGAFFEGAGFAQKPSDATEAAIEANIEKFYSNK